MKNIILLIVNLALGCLCAAAQYSVHSVSGTVTLKKGLQTTTVTTGMQLSATDMLDLAEGASIEILNPANSQTYSCSQPGITSVTSLMVRAKTMADNKGKSIRDNMNFSRSSSANAHVYVESGMVKRSMATYDPEAKNLEVDPVQLSGAVVNALRNPATLTGNECPADFIHAPNEAGGLGFTVGNNLGSPIYFNVLKIKTDNTTGISISELGQPSGSYVLLPSQTISRNHMATLPSDERHIIIMTGFNFDIDKLIEHIESMMNTDAAPTETDSDLKVFISAI